MYIKHHNYINGQDKGRFFKGRPILSYAHRAACEQMCIYLGILPSPWCLINVLDSLQHTLAMSIARSPSAPRGFPGVGSTQEALTVADYQMPICEPQMALYVVSSRVPAGSARGWLGERRTGFHRLPMGHPSDAH